MLFSLPAPPLRPARPGGAPIIELGYLLSERDKIPRDFAIITLSLFIEHMIIA